MDSLWIMEQDCSNEKKIDKNESLFTLGNGYLGMRGSLILKEKAIQKGTYINGFYEKGPITYGENAYGFAENWQTIIPLPEGKELNLTINGVELFNNKGKFIQNNRILDMKESNSVWNFTWEDEKELVYKGHVQTIIPFNMKGTALIVWDLTLPENSCDILINSPLLFDNKENSGSDDPRLPAHFNSRSLSLQKDLSDSGQQFLILEAKGSLLSSAASMDHIFTGMEIKGTEKQETENGFVYKINGKSGKTIQKEIVVSYSYDQREKLESIKKTVSDEIQLVSNKGLKKIREDQKNFMEEFWSGSDIKIEGDPEVQISLRFNLFQLLQSTGRDNKRSIAAKGLSGPGYEGHYFWDAETYVLPFFIYTNPSIARSMLKYRISILDKAIKRAALLGHEGALFPWRTINGEESSAYFPAGTAQYHINSDIALGLNKYLEVTGDLTLLYEGGKDLLAETARFWCSLGCEIQGKGICFNVVTGPDEYTALVDNNYYTNLLAKKNLEAAVFWLKEKISKIEINKWKETAEKIYLPKNCLITPQDDSFLNKEVWDFENTDDSKYPLLLNFHPLNIYRKQVLKQADVVLAQTLYRNHFSPGLMRRNFEYYETLTTRDSSLSSCAQGINAFWFGYEELSWEYFLETVHTDRKDLHKNVFFGLHTASMGGSYLMILTGFLGVEDTKGTIRFRPRLPEKLSSIESQVIIKNSLLKIHMEKESITYKAKTKKVSFYHYSNLINLKEGESVTVNTRPEFKYTIKDIEETDPLINENIIYKQIQSLGFLPEETIIHSDSERKTEMCDFMGYLSST
jgi:trehalose/maltose hydrolase-like predicted phosphorylase